MLVFDAQQQRKLDSLGKRKRSETEVELNHGNNMAECLNL
jgi:hypothetical protein